MPKHDEATSTAPVVDESLNDAQVERIDAICRILCDHLYAQPDDNDSDQCDFDKLSDDSKRIFRSCAIDIERLTRA